MKKGQSALEFIILISFMIIIFVSFFVVIQARILDVVEKNDETYLTELNSIVLRETKIAVRALPDYSHSFHMPTHIQGKPYTINLIENREVISSYGSYEQVNFLDEDVIGPLYIGGNEIHKTDGKISLKGGVIDVKPEYAGIFLNVNPEWCYAYENTEINGENMCVMFETDYRKLCQDLFGLCEEEGGLPTT